MNRFWSKVDRSAGPDECWPWTAALFKEGYGCFNFEGVTQGAHRVSYTISKGEIPKGKLVRHTCDNRPCCNPRHLVLGSSKDNHQDAVERGRHTHGESNGNSKLTDADVQDIRARYTKHCRVNGGSAMAKEYGVDQSLINRIARNKCWGHV